METPTVDWAKISRFDVGVVPSGDFAVMLRAHFQMPTLRGTPPAPVQSTPQLFLTTEQANDLLLLLAHALGHPETGIPQRLTKPPQH
jgi:hypothetical protein